jgi:hypothetical protein
MKRIVFPLFLLVVITACHRVKDGAKDAIVKTGETVGKAGTELSNGISEGMKKALESEVVLSDELKKNGIGTGKLDFTSEKDASDNVLQMYLIYNNDINGTIKVKVLDEKGLEYGRSSAVVKGKKGEAGYVDFIFDKRVNLEGKSKFIME